MRLSRGKREFWILWAEPPFLDECSSPVTDGRGLLHPVEPVTASHHGETTPVGAQPSGHILMTAPAPMAQGHLPRGDGKIAGARAPGSPLQSVVPRNDCTIRTGTVSWTCQSGRRKSHGAHPQSKNYGQLMTAGRGVRTLTGCAAQSGQLGNQTYSPQNRLGRRFLCVFTCM